MDCKRSRSLVAGLVLGSLATFAPLGAQTPGRGADPRVDYAGLTAFGPWDDRNYALTLEDLALLAPEEASQAEAIPAFYRVELRRSLGDLRRSGPAQYPRSALARFFRQYGGYLVDGALHQEAELRGGRWIRPIPATAPMAPVEGEPERALLMDNVRINGAESAALATVAINPANPQVMIAGSQDPLFFGQKMYVSTDAGLTWSPTSLPGNQPGQSPTCCDPTLDWSSDGTKAYAATMGDVIGFPLFFYRSGDGGQTWTDLATEPGNNPIRQLGTNTDKEFLHVDRYTSSPFKDNLYLSWNEVNTMMVARSTNRGHTWSTPAVIASLDEELGTGSDLTSDKNGNVFYTWAAFESKKIWVRRSVNGGATYQTKVAVADTQADFIFPIPSSESRQVLIYTSADADLTSGPFANSIYVAWTDTTGPESATPANNHARIRVAYSRDAGGTWNVSTPHETADASTVDRWHQWLKVGPDGKVHVIFYDTRQNANRQSVDVYHAVSSDGAVTWSTPQRLTTASSPNIANAYEFGDYNGLDVADQRLVAVFTDNRAENVMGGDSVDIYAAGRDLSQMFADNFETGTLGAWSDTFP